MKPPKPSLVAVALVLAGCAADALTLTPETTEVVVAPKAPDTVRFAVEELTNALSRVFASPVAVATAPTAGRRHIYLGENEWTRAAGLEPRKLPRDAFEIRVTGTDVFIAGADDPKARIAAETGPSGFFEIATVHGVYEFLERYAGVRYFFPGELGTVCPPAKAIEVPEGRLSVAPEFTVRHYSDHDCGDWMEDLPPREVARAKNLALRRYRMRTLNVHPSHGQYWSKFSQRFGATHPEYFYMDESGRRVTRDTEKRPYSENSQMCQTSAIWDEIFRDARSYFRGEGPEVRGMLVGTGRGRRPGWGSQAQGRAYYDVMPQDGLKFCHCPKCRAQAGAGSQWATPIVWKGTAEVARRLIDEGVPGTLLQMAYGSHTAVPDFPIPTNVLVMVAQTGPWNVPFPERMAKERETIGAWVRKTGAKVFLWNYVCRFGRPDPQGLPFGAPRCVGAYYKAMRDLITGSYLESNSDRFLFNYMDYYIYGKVCWNPDADVDALLADHDARMFGGGAKPMRRFFDLLERKWTREYAGNTVDTPLGPQVVVPGERKVWTSIYSPAVMKELDGDLREASAAVPPDSIEARRIDLFRREYFEPLNGLSKRYAEKAASAAKLAYAVNSPIPMRLTTRLDLDAKGSKRTFPNGASVSTEVSITLDEKSLTFDFACEEPKMGDVSEIVVKHDEAIIWQDNNVELVLEVAADGSDVRHLFLGSNGTLYDAKGQIFGNTVRENDTGWESGVESRVVRRPDGWDAHLAIPLDSLPSPLPDRMRLSVCRTRSVKTSAREYLTWSPYVNHYLDHAGWGALLLNKPKK